VDVHVIVVVAVSRILLRLPGRPAVRVTRRGGVARRRVTGRAALAAAATGRGDERGEHQQGSNAAHDEVVRYRV
jgi:hypothetical protein